MDTGSQFRNNQEGPGGTHTLHTRSGDSSVVELRNRDRKVFDSRQRRRQNFFFLQGQLSPPQWHVKDPGSFAKRVDEVTAKHTCTLRMWIRIH